MPKFKIFLLKVGEGAFFKINWVSHSWLKPEKCNLRWGGGWAQGLLCGCHSRVEGGGGVNFVCLKVCNSMSPSATLFVCVTSTEWHSIPSTVWHCVFPAVCVLKSATVFMFFFCVFNCVTRCVFNYVTGCVPCCVCLKVCNCVHVFLCDCVFNCVTRCVS